MLDTLRRIESPEGIFLSVRPAGLTARFKAYAIDGLIRLATYVMASMLLTMTGHFGTGMLLLLLFALEWLYPVFFELAYDGATPGKKAAGLRVVMDDGLPVTPAASLTRNLLRTADFLPFLYAFGLVSMLCRADFKRLGDVVAGTLVVHDEHVGLHAPLPAATPLEPARALSTSEQAAVLAWAARTQTLTPERLEELASLARPAFERPGAPSDRSSTTRLLGVAHWLLGRRAGEPGKGAAT